MMKWDQVIKQDFPQSLPMWGGSSLAPSTMLRSRSQTVLLNSSNKEFARESQGNSRQSQA
jgi:hypothetical protein